MKVGQRIRERRKSLGWTQVEAAAFLGVHPLTISKWERGLPIKPGLYQERVQAWLGVFVKVKPKATKGYRTPAGGIVSKL